jgi:DNA-binding GntR family transcriptional regulator
VAGPGRRRGARPHKFEQTKEAMRNDIQTGKVTVAELENMLEKQLAVRYGVSRDTARKARKAVLSELNSRQIPTNDN